MLATPGRGESAPSRWLKHVYPESFPERPSDLGSDVLRLRLEELATRLANASLAQHGGDPDEARKLAVCLIVEQALVLQREHAIGAYRTMLDALVAEDPAMADIRLRIAVDISERSAERGARSYAKGRSDGWSIGWVLGIVCGTIATALLSHFAS